MPIKRETGEGQAKLEKLLKGLANYDAQVGWFETSKYPDTNIPVASVAYVQEFGDPGKHIPPRLGMRATATAKEKEWRKTAQQLARGLLTGAETVESIMDTVGAVAAGDFRHTISKVMEPPLKDATVKARARKLANHKITKSLRKPLIDSGYMLDSLINITVKK
jgi:hypothetical protein